MHLPLADQEAAGPRRSAGKAWVPDPHSTKTLGTRHYSKQYGVSPCVLFAVFFWVTPFPSLYLALPPIGRPLGPSCRCTERKGSTFWDSRAMSFLPKSSCKDLLLPTIQNHVCHKLLEGGVSIGPLASTCSSRFSKNSMENLCISRDYVSNASSRICDCVGFTLPSSKILQIVQGKNVRPLDVPGYTI